MKATVCAYRAVGDGDAAFRLWERTIGRTWPLDRADFEAIVREGLVAVHDGHVVGIVAIARAERLASVQLLLVAPELRRRGIGRALIKTVLDGLSDYGTEELRLGGTPGPYFWPGVPPELVGSRPFLEHQGWRFTDPCWDLVRSLSDYESPVEVARRATGATYRWAAEDDRRRLRRFEASRFPEWAPAFAADETLERSIIALDEGGSVVGSLLASDRRRRQLWHYLLGEDSGSMGAVGVDESVRGCGIGTALVAYACEQLRERGVATCRIGWTSLLTFYGRLGFRPWRRFETATLTLGGRHAPR